MHFTGIPWVGGNINIEHAKECNRMLVGKGPNLASTDKLGKAKHRNRAIRLHFHFGARQWPRRG